MQSNNDRTHYLKYAEILTAFAQYKIIEVRCENGSYQELDSDDMNGMFQYPADDLRVRPEQNLVELLR